MQQHPQTEYRMHKTVHGNAAAGAEAGAVEQFRVGGAITKAGTIYTFVPVASASKMRFRFKSDVGGTLSAAYLSPGIIPGQFTRFGDLKDGNDLVTATGNPADVTVTGNVEAMMEINDMAGEAWVLISFTEADVAAGTVTYANHCQL